jgi:hypothetical protein
MEFLRLEVEREKRINLAKTGLRLVLKDSIARSKKRFSFKQNPKKEAPRAAGFLFTSKAQETKTRCVFCNKTNFSFDCYLAQKMGFSDKLKLLRKNCCGFSCLSPGLVAQQFKTKSRYAACGKRHVAVMCRELK